VTTIQKRRVVITGIGLATPIGHDLDAVSDALENDRHGIRYVPDFERIGELQTRLAGTIDDLDLDKRWPRQRTRSMGRVALLAAHATDAALGDAKVDEDRRSAPDVGLAYGSTHGSSVELESFCRQVFGKDSLEGISSSAYLRFMSHTTTANLAGLYGIRGRVISTCAACVSASQAIGAGYEAIGVGAQNIMICGGSEELHWVPAGVFDILFATSHRYNDRPHLSPRPFDVARDGLVIAEGAGTVILEELEHARARGAHIYAELLGYGTNCDGSHLTSPSAEGMADAMRLSLRDAGLRPGDIQYVNAHATATQVGDVSESHATRSVLGEHVPISSTKGFTGHTLGACGTIEVAFCVAMMRDGFLAPTRNLRELDPECALLDYVMDEPRRVKVDRVMTNNFAFGGINTSLILGSYEA
jgi:3-oxoacyl-[acyl-carrier-protein] synthase II